MNFYLYRHIRLDKNEPFYIGIGTKPKKHFISERYEYNRAFSKQRKDSKIWNLIISKTDYYVEILLESDDYNFIKEKEKEFIKLYGRIDNKTGILANMTDGGDGTLGMYPSEETKLRLKIARNRPRIYKGINIYQYNLEGSFIKKWENITEAAKEIKVNKGTLSKLVRKGLNNYHCKGYYWSFELSDKVETGTYKIPVHYKIKYKSL